MIEVRNLTKKYGKNTVVNRLNFTIENGKIYGFLGPNGAGKTTTMNMITGCLAATEGEVIINGHDIYEEPVLAKKSIGYLPEQPPVYPDMTPREYLKFVAEAKGIHPAEIEDQVDTVMNETGISGMQNRLIKNLSKGYRQRVGIAQAMLGNPELIILDEPTVGLDPYQIIEIRDLIMNLGTNHTVMLSSHILGEVSAICDHVMIIKKGNLVASDTLENIRRQYAPENTVSVTVKADFDKIKEILSGIDGIIKYEAIRQAGSEEIYDVSIEVEKDADIREKLFFAFAEQKCGLTKLTSSALSLEEVFIKLTSEEEDVKNLRKHTSDEGEEDDDGIEAEYEEEDNDGEDDDEDEDGDDDGEDDYVPLFGGSSKDDGEDDDKK